jgi:hypothetical protein
MKRKPNLTQKLIQSIMEQYKITDLNEAWRIYRQKYEQDKELDPSSKIVVAKNIGQALKAEKTAAIYDISQLEEKEAEEQASNTHAIGFHIPPDIYPMESYDPSP